MGRHKSQEKQSDSTRSPYMAAAAFRNVSMFTSIGSERTILDRVSFEVRPGEIVRLAGESGSGKSTIMRMLLDLEEPTEGVVELFDQDIHRLPTDDYQHLKARRVGVVLQNPSLLGNNTGWENLLDPLAQRGVHIGPQERRRAVPLLGRLGIGIAELEMPAAMLSAGQQQRLSFASDVLHLPDLLLLDEASSAQDPDRKATIFRMISEYVHDPYADHPRSALLITHDAVPKDVTIDHEIVLSRGRIQQEHIFRSAA